MRTRAASPLLLVGGQSSKQLSLGCCLNLDSSTGIVRNKQKVYVQRIPDHVEMGWDLLYKTDHFKKQDSSFGTL